MLMFSVEVWIRETDKLWSRSTEIPSLLVSWTAQMGGESEREREIFIIHVSNVPMCGQVRVERRLLQPHGCDELSDDQTRVQDAGQPTAEEPSQRSQQR